MSSFKAKMHQNQFRLGLRLRFPIAEFENSLLRERRRKTGEDRKREKKIKGRGRRRKERKRRRGGR